MKTLLTGKTETSVVFFKKGRNEDTGNHRTMSLTSVSEKIMEAISRHIQHKEEIKDS